MIKNIIFDFDGVIVDSEVLVAKSISKYLFERGIIFKVEEFSQLAGNKTVEVISQLSSKFNIKDEKTFYKDIMFIAKNLYENELEPIKGVKSFLKKLNQNKLIGSNNLKSTIIEGLKKIKMKEHFLDNHIFSFDLVEKPKPYPDLYLKAINDTKINVEETIIIEDSAIGTQAGVAAGVKVIGLTAGGHWFENRSEKELYDAGAYEVVNSYEDMLLLLDTL